MKDKIFNLDNENNVSGDGDKMTDSIAAFWILMRERTVFTRSHGKLKLEAHDFLKKADREIINKLEELLFAYESEPIAIFLNDGVAFAVPSFMRSSGLYMIAIPSVSAKAASFAIDKGMLGDIEVIGEPVSYKYAGGTIKKQAEKLSKWFCEICESYGSIEHEDGRSLGELMRVRIQMIAEHIGASAKAVTVGEISRDERLDLSLFVSFTTVMLSLAKKRSCGGSVAVTVGEVAHGAHVRISFEYEGRSPRYDIEAEVLHGIADK